MGKRDSNGVRRVPLRGCRDLGLEAGYTLRSWGSGYRNTESNGKETRRLHVNWCSMRIYKGDDFGADSINPKQ